MASLPSTIFDALRESHSIQREWCTRLTRTQSNNVPGRMEAFRTLKLELAAHASAEERFLYAPILMDDAGLNSARHALSEHHELDELVEDLGKLDPAGDAFGEKAKALSQQVRHHLKEEESKFFQMAGKVLADTQKALLARKYLKNYAHMKKKLAADWGWKAERATRTDTPAVRRARQDVKLASEKTRVARVARAGR